MNQESHLSIGSTNQVLYPTTGNSTVVELKIKLGSKVHQYKRDAYTLIDWMIDMGGISETLYIGGMIIAHVIAT